MAKLNLELMESIAQQMNKAQEERAQRRNIIRYEWKSGSNQIRLMESTFDDGRLALPVYRHWIAKTPYVCVAQTYPANRIMCPICQALIEVERKGISTDNFEARGKAITNCVDRYETNRENAVKLIELPMSAYNYLVLQVTLRDKMNGMFVFGDITDSLSGRDIFVVKKVGERTSYETSLSPQVSPLHPEKDVVDMWMKARYSIQNMYRFPDETYFVKLKTVAEGILLSNKIDMATATQAVASAPPTIPVNATVHSDKQPGPQQQKTMPKCYSLDWREEKAMRPAKCLPCPFETACSAEVKKKISAGFPLPDHQTPMWD